MDIFSQEILAIIGIIALAIILLLALATAIALVSAYLIFRDKQRVERISRTFSNLFLKFLLLVLDVSYVASKKIVSSINGEDMMIDTVSVRIRNALLRKNFRKVPFEDRIVLFPQCLRNLDCETSFSSIEGAKCLKCGKCKIKDAVEKAQELGYKGTYIAPGGGFVKRIIKKTNPSAVIGIGCPYEVNAGMLQVSSKGIPVQGVMLLEDGCVETDIDLEELFEVMELESENA